MPQTRSDGVLPIKEKKKYVLNKDESGVDADETMRGAAETFLDSDDTCYTTKEKKNKKKI